MIEKGCKMNVERLVKISSHGFEKRKMIHEAAMNGEIIAYILHPITKEVIKVHPETVKRLKDGEVLTVKDVLNERWH
jgi:uncharacterized protein YlzI (FlbEa/FlbD family)